MVSRGDNGLGARVERCAGTAPVPSTESRRNGKTGTVSTLTKRPTSLLTLIVALTLALAGCGGDDAPREQEAESTAEPALPTRAQPAKVSGGTATLALSGNVTTLLDLAGVDVVPVAPATMSESKIELPVVTGTVGVKPLAGRLAHKGGIAFGGGGGRLEATDLRLDLRTGVATAEVEGNRIPLLKTRFQPAQLSEDRQSVLLEGEDVTVADEAIAPLNAAIGSEVVPRDLNIGELTVEARWP